MDTIEHPHPVSVAGAARTYWLITAALRTVMAVMVFVWVGLLFKQWSTLDMDTIIFVGGVVTYLAVWQVRLWTGGKALAAGEHTIGCTPTQCMGQGDPTPDLVLHAVQTPIIAAVALTVPLWSGPRSAYGVAALCGVGAGWVIIHAVREIASRRVTMTRVRAGHLALSLVMAVIVGVITSAPMFIWFVEAMLIFVGGTWLFAAMIMSPSRRRAPHAPRA